MANDAKSQSDLLKQISDAFQVAQQQLAELRLAVQHNSDLAQMTSMSAFTQRERERAFKVLGEAVFKEVQAGRLNVPPVVAAAVEAVKNVDAKMETQRREISDILGEGSEAAARLPPKTKPPANSPLASRTKKR